MPTYTARVDAVSDAVQAIRTGRPLVARTRCVAPWGLRFQPSTGPGFHVVLQGTCWAMTDSGAPPVRLEAGDVLFVSHGQAIALADDPSSDLADATKDLDDAWAPQPAADATAARTVLMCGSYQFARIRPHPLLTELPDTIHIPRQIGRHTSLAALIDLLAGELDGRQAGTDAIVTGLLDTMLLYILRAWYQEQAGKTQAGWSAALTDPAISAALHQLHHDPSHPWTVEELGRRAGLSRAAFARKFTALIGRPPLDYLTWWRLTIAGTLLRLDEAPLQSIAEQSGYTSESAFNRAFKREYGTSPGMYRRSHNTRRPSPHDVS